MWPCLPLTQVDASACPICTRKEGNPPQQTMDFEELEKKNSANNTSELDEDFYGDETYDPSELDDEGFADLNMDDDYTL